eukprot:gene19357-26006_t
MPSHPPQRPALATPNLASSRLASSNLGIKPEDSPGSCFLIMGNVMEHDNDGNDNDYDSDARAIKPDDSLGGSLLVSKDVAKLGDCDDECDDGCKPSAHSTSLHLPCLQPATLDPTIGRLIMVEDAPENDCSTPSLGTGFAFSHSAHDISPPLSQPSGSSPPSVLPQAAGRCLASLRQPKTSTGKLILLGPYACEMDFTPCTDFVPPYVAPKSLLPVSFSTGNLVDRHSRSSKFASYSAVMNVSSQSGGRAAYQPQPSARARTSGALIDFLEPGALMKLDKTLLPTRQFTTPVPHGTWYSTMLRSKMVIDPCKSDHTHRL